MTALATSRLGGLDLSSTPTRLDEPLSELPAGRMLDALRAVGLGATQVVVDPFAGSGMLAWLGGTIVCGALPMHRAPALDYLENPFRRERQTPFSIVVETMPRVAADPSDIIALVAFVRPKEPVSSAFTVVAPNVSVFTVTEPDLLPTPERVLVSEPIAEPAPPPAYVAFEELRDWIGMTAAEVADVIGVGRTTPYTWLRQGCEPQPTTSRRLYQVHSIIKAVRDRLGEAGMRVWAEGGNPSPLEVLRSTGYEGLMRLAHVLLFGRPAEAGPLPGSFIPEETEAPRLQSHPGESAALRRVKPKVARRRR
jgi:hypothetical protein